MRCQTVQPPPLPRSALRRNTLGGSELEVSEVHEAERRPHAHTPRGSVRRRAAVPQAMHDGVSAADWLLLRCHGQQVALGSMTWGKQNSQADAHAQLSWAVDAGINFVVRANPNLHRLVACGSVVLLNRSQPQGRPGFYRAVCTAHEYRMLSTVLLRVLLSVNRTDLNLPVRNRPPPACPLQHASSRSVEWR